jgi:hypothetical protein
VSSATWTQSGGWLVKVTITVTGPIRATDASSVDALYTASGGSAPAPCFQNRSSGTLDTMALPIQNARVWVGTLRYDLVSPISSGWPTTGAYFDSENGRILARLGWSGSKPCYSQVGTTGLTLDTSTKTDTAATIPLVLVDWAAYSPDHPNGVDPPALSIQSSGTISSGPGQGGSEMPVTLPR